MDKFSQNKADREHAAALKGRIETSLLAEKIGREARNSPAAKTRDHIRKLTAERDALHAELGKKIAEKAAEIQRENPAISLATAYLKAGKILGVHQ